MSPPFDDDFDLRTFSGVTRLFPLPGVVLFPQNVLPMHIFEPRYRQMIEDALAGDRLITIVQVPTPTQWLPSGEPVIETIGCLGRIIKHERLSDGRFNFLLVGRRRIKLTREIDGSSLYRSAEGQILEDLATESPDDPRRRELSHLFRMILQREDAVDSELASLLESNRLNLGQLTDIIAHAIGFPPSLKQSLLAEIKPEKRADGLLKVLKQVVGANPPESGSGRSFPPDFSVN